MKGHHIANNNKVVYLIVTDVIGSSDHDNGSRPSDLMKWREASFVHQLSKILKEKNRIAVKSIGDALFIRINNIPKDITLEINLCCDILNSIYEASQETVLKLSSTVQKRIEIRTVVHRITEFANGKNICKKLNILKLSGDYKLFCETLRKEIFGKEVNKTIRIQNQVKGKAILVSDEIVRLFCAFEEKNFEEILFRGEDYCFNNTHGLKFHSPVPLFYLKGTYDFLEKKDRLLSVFQLGKTDIDNIPENISVMAGEFKRYQLFRFINCDYKMSCLRDFPTKESLIFDQLHLINSPINDVAILHRFYTDMLFSVHDFFSLSNIGINRIQERINQGTLKDNFTSFKKLSTNIYNEYGISGQARNLLIDASNDTLTVKLAEDSGRNRYTGKQLPLIAFSSYPDEKTASMGRKLFEKKDIKIEGNSFNTQPQTLPIYNTIKFVDSKPNQESKDNDSILSGKFILLILGCYNENVREADTNSIFKEIESTVNVDDYQVSFYGLMPGLIDAFVLFRINDLSKPINIDGVEECKILSQILSKFFLPRTISIYLNCYPISVYLLETVKEYPMLNRNHRLLFKNASVNYSNQ